MEKTKESINQISNRFFMQPPARGGEKGCNNGTRRPVVNRQGHYRVKHTRAVVLIQFSYLHPKTTQLAECLIFLCPRARIDLALTAQFQNKEDEEKSKIIMTTPALHLEDAVKLQKVRLNVLIILHIF
jgi:hypothetical protein